MLHVIENVPVIGCSHCGESYLTADTLVEIADSGSSPSARALAAPRSVPVAVFA